MISVICLRICWRRHLRWFSKMCNFSASNRNYAVHPRAQEFKWCVRIGWGSCGIRLWEPPCRYFKPTNDCKCCASLDSTSPLLAQRPEKGVGVVNFTVPPQKKHTHTCCVNCPASFAAAKPSASARSKFLPDASVKRFSCAGKDGSLEMLGMYLP